jgi:hypothetical protein
VERMLRSLSRDVDGEIVGHRMEVYVSCAECSATRGPGLDGLRQGDDQP